MALSSPLLTQQRPSVRAAMILVNMRMSKQSESSLTQQRPSVRAAMILVNMRMSKQSESSSQLPKIAKGGTPKEWLFCKLSTPVDANLLTQKIQKHLDGEDGNKVRK